MRILRCLASVVAAASLAACASVSVPPGTGAASQPVAPSLDSNGSTPAAPAGPTPTLTPTPRLPIATVTNPPDPDTSSQDDPKGTAQITHLAGPYTFSLPPFPHSTDPAICGDWAAATTIWGRSVASRYGDVQNCFRDRESWVVTTDAGPGRRSAVGIDRCSNAACLDGSVDHGGDDWVFFNAPQNGRIKNDNVPTATTLSLRVGGWMFTFDLDTHVFTGPPGPHPAAE